MCIFYTRLNVIKALDFPVTKKHSNDKNNHNTISKLYNYIKLKRRENRKARQTKTSKIGYDCEEKP